MYAYFFICLTPNLPAISIFHFEKSFFLYVSFLCVLVFCISHFISYFFIFPIFPSIFPSYFLYIPYVSGWAGGLSLSLSHFEGELSLSPKGPARRVFCSHEAFDFTKRYSSLSRKVLKPC